MWYIYYVCIGEANYLRYVLTNGFTAAIATIGELPQGKGWLVMWSWV